MHARSNGVKGEEIVAEKASDLVVRKCISAAPEGSTP
jgi:hypothetical protein